MHPIVAPNKACEIFWAAVLYKLRVLNIYPFAVSKISFCFFFFSKIHIWPVMKCYLQCLKPKQGKK